MKEHIEKEYKVLLNREQFDVLIELLQPEPAFCQTNRYFDTAERYLQKHGDALRIREKNGQFLFTLKVRKNADTLLEYEGPVDRCDASAFEQSDIQELLHAHGVCQPLQQIAELRTWRAIHITDHAEICLDINQYQGHTDYEIEYEYTQPHDGRTCFQSILDHVHITYETNCASKIARAMAVSGGAADDRSAE